MPRRPSPLAGLLSVALAVSAAACGDEPDIVSMDGPAPTDAIPAFSGGEGWTDGPDGWAWTVAADLGEKLAACVLADVEPDSPGDEIVAVAESGKVWRVMYGDDGWDAELLATLPGEAVQIAAGDIDPARPGDELVTAGMATGPETDAGPGAAHVLFRGDAGWQVREMFAAPALLHAVAVTDMDPTRDGVEVLVAGFTEEARILALGVDGWDSLATIGLPGPGKNAVPHMEGAAVACSDGSVVHIYREPDGTWHLRSLAKRDGGAARLGSDDEHLLVARDDGTVELVGANVGRIVHRESERMRGAVLANVDPGARGLEYVSAGYEGRVVVSSDDGDGRRSTTVVYDDGQKLHHLVAGPIWSVAGGNLLVTCGFSGRLVVMGKVVEPVVDEGEDG